MKCMCPHCHKDIVANVAVDGKGVVIYTSEKFEQIKKEADLLNQKRKEMTVKKETIEKEIKNENGYPKDINNIILRSICVVLNLAIIVGLFAGVLYIGDQLVARADFANVYVEKLCVLFNSVIALIVSIGSGCIIAFFIIKYLDRLHDKKAKKCVSIYFTKKPEAKKEYKEVLAFEEQFGEIVI